MSSTGQPTVTAIATSRGLYFATMNGESLTVATTYQLPGKDVRCIRHVKGNLLVLGFFNSLDLFIFDTSQMSIVRSFKNPSGDKYPWKLLSLKNGFLLSDQAGISFIDIGEGGHRVLMKMENPKKGFSVVCKEGKLLVVGNEVSKVGAREIIHIDI